MVAIVGEDDNGFWGVAPDGVLQQVVDVIQSDVEIWVGAPVADRGLDEALSVPNLVL